MHIHLEHGHVALLVPRFEAQTICIIKMLGWMVGLFSQFDLVYKVIASGQLASTCLKQLQQVTGNQSIYHTIF